MQRLRNCAPWRYLVVFVAASMVVPYATMSVPVVAEAQPQSVFGSSTVVVLPISDASGAVGSAESQKATAAMAMALDDAGEFVVTAKRDYEREIAAMGLEPPLAVPEQTRLAKRLQVEKVLSGSIASLSVHQRTGQVRVALVVELLDIATGEFLDGANVAITTKSIPGWSGERNQVINEALRQVAEAAASHILMTRTPVGYVTSVSNNGQISVNIGAEDGIEPGTEMVIMRPIYQEDLGVVRLIKMGKIAVRTVESDMCWAAPLARGRAKVGDRTYSLHMNVARVKSHQRTVNMKSTTKLIAALAAALGIAAIATGDHTASAPDNVSARLFQASPGDEAVIRVRVPASSIPLTDQVFAWLFFRQAGQQNFPLNAENLVDIWPEPKLSNSSWDDTAATRADVEFAATYTYIGPDGDEEDVDVDITYNHRPLLAGATYYYRVQRIVMPEQRAGSGAPISTTQVGPAQVFEPAELDVDPVDALSEGSKPTNPVTYFSPVTPQSPAAGVQNQSTTSITFTWTTALGANQYVLQVFPEDDPNGLRTPDFQVQQRRDASGTMTQNITGNFAPNSRFYWRVGARREGEATPMMGGIEGWLFSETRTFTTAVAPPPPPGTAAAGTAAQTYTGSSGLPRYGH